MPSHGFEWASDEEVNRIEQYFKIKTLRKYNKKPPDKWEDFFGPAKGLKQGESYGYFLEVDYDYPRNLHDAHSDMPLAPRNQAVFGHDLSNKQVRILKELDKDEINHRSQKLVTSLYDQTHYIGHYKALDYYSTLGLEIVRVRRAVRFVQSKFLKPWIELCTSKRTECGISGDEAGRAFWKLLINSCFGKFCEDLKKRKRTKFISKIAKARKEISSPLFESAVILNQNLIQINSLQPSIHLNKPLSIGVTILELSKMTMYSYFYSFLKVKLGHRVRLLYTDTDSLIVKITTHDIDRDIASLKKTLDTSNFDPSHSLFSKEHESQLYFMKFEMATHEIGSFISLKAKVYNILMFLRDRKGVGKDITERDDGLGEVRKVKGVPRTAVRELQHDHFLNVLSNNEKIVKMYHKLAPSNHIIHLVREKKTALTSFDDKRYVLECGIHSRPHGHYLNDSVGDMCGCDRLG